MDGVCINPQISKCRTSSGVFSLFDIPTRRDSHLYRLFTLVLKTTMSHSFNLSFYTNINPVMHKIHILILKNET